ncbi:MAG: YncE family protein [Candidatus Marsarchaeota archaeon]|nr:YncE family protein [Candidatus Marsarchaeota archaeon]
MRNMRAQSAIEYLATYGWALLIIVIAIAMILLFITVPSGAASNACSFTTSIVKCNDFVLGSNTASQTTTFAINITNMQQYPIENPTLVVSILNNNYTVSTCAPQYVAAGGSILCYGSMPVSTSYGQLFSGSMYLGISNCALSSNYINSGECSNPQGQTILGHYVGHSEAPYLMTPTPGEYVIVGSFGFDYGAITSIYVANNVIANTVIISPHSPMGIAISPDGTKIYASTATGVAGSGVLSTFDISNTMAVNSIPIPYAYGLAVTPNGKYVIVANTQGENVVVVNAANYGIVGSISTSPASSPELVAVTPDSTRAFVTDFSTNQVSVLDLEKMTLLDTINVGQGPSDIAITPSGNEAFVVNSGVSGSGSVSVISTTTYSVLGTTFIGNLASNPQFVAINPSGTQAWVSGSGNVVVLNTYSPYSVAATFSVGSPEDIAFSVNGNEAFVTNGVSVDVIYTSNYVIANMISVPSAAAIVVTQPV